MQQQSAINNGDTTIVVHVWSCAMDAWKKTCTKIPGISCNRVQQLPGMKGPPLYKLDKPQADFQNAELGTLRYGKQLRELRAFSKEKMVD